MNEKLTQLAERRKYLIDQAAEQRATLSQAAEPWRITLARADAGLAALNYVKSHSIWLIGAGGTLLVLLGPARILRWLGRGLIAWRMVNRLRNM